MNEVMASFALVIPKRLIVSTARLKDRNDLPSVPKALKRKGQRGDYGEAL